MSPSFSGRLRRNKAASDASSRGTQAPAGPGRIDQFRQTLDFAKQVDPKITTWMAGAALLAFLVCLGIGFLIGHPIVWALVGIPMAVLAAVVVMTRRTDTGAFKMIEGKPGATLAALSGIRRGGWYIPQEPVAVDGRPQGQDWSNVATLYRAVGRPGVVLVAEGPTARAKKLLVAEQKKVERLAPGAPVHQFRVGEGDDTVPVRKLSRKIQMLRPVLTKDEVSTVNKRLKAMSGMRSGVPAGMDPSKVRPSRPR